MKKVLIIAAHPKEESLTLSLAKHYAQASSAAGHKVETLDLYRCEQQQPFFTYDDANDLVVTEEMAYFQEKIGSADELVFFFPYWWGSFPAILKNFFDWNLSKGFAFKYVDSRPQGLLQGKKVKVFTTTGAPKFIYTLTGANRRLKKMIDQQIVSFCGMTLERFNIYGGVDTSGKNVDKIFEDIIEKI